MIAVYFFSSRRRHTRYWRDWSSDVCSSDLKDVFKSFKKVQSGKEELSITTANVIANAIKLWAIENGATHFTHWFQPLTELTAEKHEAFLSVHSDGTSITEDRKSVV